MVNVICDACKKSIPAANLNENYFILANKHICIKCESKIEETLREKMAKLSSHTLKSYDENMKKIVESVCK